jgi:FkbM family methyltransferase
MASILARGVPRASHAPGSTSNNVGLSVLSLLSSIRYLRHGPLRGLGPVWLWLGNAYRALVRGSGMSVKQHVGGYGPFRFDAKFTFSDFSSWGHGHNDGFRRCIETCRGCRCVLDIGAHVGLVSLPAASVMAANGVVHAFEPAEANRSYLTRHIALNGFEARVIIHPELVGETDRDDVAFYELEESTGMNSVVPGAMGDDYRRTQHRQITVDTFCRQHNLAPDVIKIDVEGAEIGVLLGAKETIARVRPTIFLSVHPRQIALLGQSVEQLASLIASFDYSVENADGTPVDSFALREYVLTSRELPQCP